MALNGRAGGADQCPKLGVERTQKGYAATAESGPEADLPSAAHALSSTTYRKSGKGTANAAT